MLLGRLVRNNLRKNRTLINEKRCQKIKITYFLPYTISNEINLLKIVAFHKRFFVEDKEESYSNSSKISSFRWLILENGGIKCAREGN